MPNDPVDHDLDDDLSPAGGALAAWALPLGTSLVALAVGAMVGGGIVAMIPRKPTLVEVSRALTNEEIESICAPVVGEAVAAAATDLESAESKVRTLEAQVSERQAEVAALEAEMKKRGVRGAELAKQLEDAKRVLSIVEGELERALQEKEALVVELRKTEIALEEQVAKTVLAKDEGVVFKWRSFVGLAQLQICDKGARRKMGRCRETVAASMEGEIRKGVEHCLRAEQEAPTLAEVSGKNGELPRFAVWLNQDERVTRGWYIRLCDPTLPEATNFQDFDLGEATDEALR